MKENIICIKEILELSSLTMYSFTSSLNLGAVIHSFLSQFKILQSLRLLYRILFLHHVLTMK